MIYRDVLKATQSWVLSQSGKEFFATLLKDKLRKSNRKERRRRMLRREGTYSGSSRVDYSTTKWGKLIRHPNVGNIESYQGKLFHRRFRLPFVVFQHIVSICEDKNVFEIKKAHKTLVPVDIKVLICLRILARGNCSDDISELSDVGVSTCNRVFKVFCKNFRTIMQPIHIPEPSLEEIRSIMSVYEKLGLPGTVGSVDGTHVRWDKCPVRLTSLCTGKEPFPTVGFQAVVDHSRRVLHITDGFYGSMNDKNLSNFDDFIFCLRNGTLYGDVEYDIYDSNGVLQRVKGVHVICDGGYQKEACLMNPFQFRLGKSMIYWSEWVESVRKDVECFFGVLKARFRFFKTPVVFHSMTTISDAMICACVCCTICYSDLMDWISVDGKPM